MRNRTYGGVRGRKMTVGGKQPTSFSSYSIEVGGEWANVLNRGNG